MTPKRLNQQDERWDLATMDGHDDVASTTALSLGRAQARRDRLPQSEATARTLADAVGSTCRDPHLTPADHHALRLPSIILTGLG